MFLFGGGVGVGLRVEVLLRWEVSRVYFPTSRRPEDVLKHIGPAGTIQPIAAHG